MAEMVPEPPKCPAFPELTWEYSEGRYSISEEDADRLLDYGENQLPLYRFELDRYRRKIQTVLDGLSGKSDESEEKEK